MRSENESRRESDTFDVRITPGAALTNAANRLLFSRGYSIFYLFMILLNVALILWVIIDLSVLGRFATPTHWLFITLEVLINIALLTEVTLRMLSLKSRYFLSWSNIFDLSVLVISWLGLIIFFSSSALMLGEVDDVGTLLLLILRYIVQFLRLLLMVKNQKKASSGSKSVVDFSTLSSDSIPLRDSTAEEEDQYTTR